MKNDSVHHAFTSFKYILTILVPTLVMFHQQPLNWPLFFPSCPPSHAPYTSKTLCGLSEIQIDLLSCFHFSWGHTEVLSPLDTHLPPYSFHSVGLVIVSGATEEKRNAFTRPPVSCFYEVILEGPCSLCQFLLEPAFAVTPVTFPLLTRFCKGCHRYSFSHQEGN